MNAALMGLWSLLATVKLSPCCSCHMMTTTWNDSFWHDRRVFKLCSTDQEKTFTKDRVYRREFFGRLFGNGLRHARQLNRRSAERSDCREKERQAPPNDPRREVIIDWGGQDQAFIAAAPELPGCAADGATCLVALAEVEVVIGGWIVAANEPW
jgi:predicted RNase H-like HicB family nuclease